MLDTMDSHVFSRWLPPGWGTGMAYHRRHLHSLSSPPSCFCRLSMTRLLSWHYGCCSHDAWQDVRETRSFKRNVDVFFFFFFFFLTMTASPFHKRCHDSRSGLRIPSSRIRPVRATIHACFTMARHASNTRYQGEYLIISSPGSWFYGAVCLELRLYPYDKNSKSSANIESRTNEVYTTRSSALFYYSPLQSAPENQLSMLKGRNLSTCNSMHMRQY
ncbi:hypothetical protein HDV57DRAFT_42100 [Trichoderma longibrachiatum]